MLLGSATCVLVYLLGRRVFGERAGLLAGLLGGSYVMLIYFDGQLLTNVLENLLYTLALWLVLRAPDERGCARWWLAGAVTGLSALARPTILVIAAGVLAWMKFVLPKERFRRQVTAYAVGVILLVLPATAYNVVAGRDLVLVAWQGGIGFYVGNNSHANGWSAVAPEFPKDWWGGYHRAIEIAEATEGRHLKPSEVSRFWYGQGLTFLRDAPLSFLRLWGRKLLLFWTAHEYGNNHDFYFFRRYASLLRWPLPNFGMIAPLALAGMILLVRGRPAALLALYVLLYMATISAFFVCDKLRLPVVPVLLIFASAFVLWWIERVRRREFCPALAALLLGAALAGPVNLDLTGAPRPSLAPSHFVVAGVHGLKGELDQAEEEYRACLARNPRYPEAHLRLGDILVMNGRPEEALWHYERERANTGESAELRGRLGGISQVSGDYENAVRHYRRGLELDARDLDLRFNLGVCLAHLDSLDEASDVFREIQREDPTFVPVPRRSGMSQINPEHWEKALSVWKDVGSESTAAPLDDGD
jgi:tetratricopeptide (TPR) repeat protein